MLAKTPLARPRRSVHHGATRAHRLFITPAVVALVVLGAYPLVFAVAASLSDSPLGAPFRAWVGTENFEALFADEDATASFVRVVCYAFAVTIASVLLGVIAALALHRAAKSGHVVRTILLLPLITPPVVVAILWKLIYNPAGGLLNTVAGALDYRGEPLSVLAEPGWALAGIAVADVWEWTPIVTLLVFAALLGQDPEITEAAALDGAHGWRLFRRITLPAIAGTVAAAFLVRLVLAFKVFDLVYVLTAGGPGTSTTVPAYLIWQRAIQQFDLGAAAATTLVLAVVVTLVTLPVVAITRGFHHDAQA